MVNELKHRQQQQKQQRDKHNILGRDEIYHGALEDILLGNSNIKYNQQHRYMKIYMNPFYTVTIFSQI